MVSKGTKSFIALAEKLMEADTLTADDLLRIIRNERGWDRETIKKWKNALNEAHLFRTLPDGKFKIDEESLLKIKKEAGML